MNSTDTCISMWILIGFNSIEKELNTKRKLNEKDMTTSKKGSFLYVFDKEKYAAKLLNNFILGNSLLNNRQNVNSIDNKDLKTVFMSLIYELINDYVLPSGRPLF